MRRCHRIEPVLSDYLEGELPRRQRSSLRAHLAHCPACAGETRDMSRMLLLRHEALPPHRPGPGLWSGFAAKMGWTQGSPPRAGIGLWTRWVAANAVAELLGLGATSALLWKLMTPRPGVAETATSILASAATAVVVGALVEGAAVGAAQWLVLRRHLPTLSAGSWMRATTLGAGVAWLLGMAPSTILNLRSLGPESAAPAGGGMSHSGVYLLAAVMGLALGPILALPQWRVLRGRVDSSAQWILANALAWAVGMPTLFWGIGNSVRRVTLPQQEILLDVGLTFLVAGALVGAVHGWFLIRLLRTTRAIPAERVP